MIDIDDLGLLGLAAILKKVAADIERQEGGTIAETVPVQLSFIPPEPKLERCNVDLDELMPDGKRRWISVKEAAGIDYIQDNAMYRRCAKEDGLSASIGGKIRVDRKRLMRMK